MQPLIEPFYGGYLSAHRGDGRCAGRHRSDALRPRTSHLPKVKPRAISRISGGDRLPGDGRRHGERATTTETPGGRGSTGPLLKRPGTGVTPTGGGLEVAFRIDPNVLDGRYSNNGWLQELPKPFTKIVWDNAA